MSLCNKTEELAQMENMLRDAESNVQNMLLITASKEDELCLLLMQLEDQKQTKLHLEKQLEIAESASIDLENKVFELRESLCEADDRNKQLTKANLELKKRLEEAKKELREERSKPWYKNAGELAKGSLLALQYAAFLMLPALPKHIGKK